MTDHFDDRSSLAVATAWASQVIGIAFEMALPALGGHWLDRWLGIGPWFLLAGVLLGIAAGMWHLMWLAKTLKKGTLLPGDSREPDDSEPRNAQNKKNR